MKARLLRRAVFVLISVGVLLLAVFFVLRALFPPVMLRELAVQKMEDATGLDISVEDARISFVHWRIGVRVSGVEISRVAGQESTKLASVPQIGVVVALGPLLRKEIVMEQVYVERPDISVVVGESPGAVVDTSEATSTGVPAPSVRMPLLMTLVLPRIVVRDANVRIKDERSGAVITASRLDSRSHVRAERGGEILSSEGSFSSKEVSVVPGQEPPFPLAPVEVEGSWKIRVNSLEKLVNLDRVSLAASGLPVEAAGTIDLAEVNPKLDLEVRLDGASVGALMGFIPEEALEKIPELKLAGRLVASADIEGRLPSPDYRGSFELIDGTGSISGRRLGKIVAHGGFDKSVVTLEEFAASLGASKVGGSVALSTSEPRRATFSCAGELWLEELIALLPPSDGPKVKKGEVSFNVRGEGLLDQLASDPMSVELEGTASVNGVEVQLPEPTPPVVVDKAELGFSGRRVNITGAIARVGTSVFNIEGTVHDWKKRSVTFQVQSPHVNLEELFEPFRQGGGLPAGEGGTPFVVPPMLLAGIPAEGSARLQVKTLTYEYFRGEDLSAGLLFGGDSVVVSGITMSTFGGKCSGEGRLVLSRERVPIYKGSFSANEVELADLLISFTPVKEFLKGQTFLEIDFEGELGQDVPPLSSVVATGRVRTAKASAIASPLVAAVTAWTGLEPKGEYPLKDFATSFLVEDGRLVVPRCRLADENSVWEFSGSTGFDGTLNHRVNVTFSPEYSGKIASLKGLERLLKDNEGRVVLDFTLGGTVKRPSLKWDRSRMEERAKEYLAEKLRQELEKGKQESEELSEELKGGLEEKVEKLKKEAAEKGQKLLDELFKKKDKKKE